MSTNHDCPACRSADVRHNRTNPFAIAALVCGIGIFCGGFLLGVPAVILGHKARHQIRRTHESGDGLAKAGLILGYFSIVSTAFLFFVLLGGSHPPVAPPVSP